MMPIRFEAEALRELQDAADYYEDQRRGLGDEFLDEFDKAARSVQQFPNTWPKISAKSRRRRLDRFPYGVVYQVLEHEQEILILAVMHLRRMPGYWLDREK